ncbi:MAG: EF-hand domain-containing protein [Xenococcaceae cyanobacterium]
MLTEAQAKANTLVFKRVDLNNDGYLDQSDYENRAEQVAGNLGYDYDSPECNKLKGDYIGIWNEIKSTVDKDGDGKVSLDEYLAFVDSSYSKGDVFEKRTIPLTDSLFDLLDQDKDGFISLKEFKKVDKAYQNNASVAEKVFNMIDANGDGKISKDELRQLARDSYMSTDPSNPGRIIADQ